MDEWGKGEGEGVEGTECIECVSPVMPLAGPSVAPQAPDNLSVSIPTFQAFNFETEITFARYLSATNSLLHSKLLQFAAFYHA